MTGSTWHSTIAAPDARRPEAPDRDPARFLNRELSWLDFNARVLALAEDADAAAARAGEVPRHLQRQPRRVLPGAGRRAQEQFARRDARHARPTASTPASSSARSAPGPTSWSRRQAASFTKEIAPGARRRRASASSTGTTSPATTAADLDDGVRGADLPGAHAARRRPGAPVPVHLEPVAEPRGRRARPRPPARSASPGKVPPLLPRFVVLPDDERFVPLEQVIAAHLDTLFPGMEILAHHAFRVTRDADFELEDEAEDLLEAIEAVLRRRNKFGRVVRLEIDATMSPTRCSSCCAASSSSPNATSRVVDGPLDLAGLWALYALDRPELKDEPWAPQTPDAARRPRRCEPTCSGCSRPATCSSTTRTTRSPRRSRRSSSRRPTTRTCSRSSRRSTAPRARRARSSARS